MSAGRFCRLLLAMICCVSTTARAGETNNPAAPDLAPVESLASALSTDEWHQLEGCVDRTLAWLARQQQPDGSFPTRESAQPAVTSLCILAFLSRGYQPGGGPYGAQLDRAIDYVLDCQMADGLICRLEPEPILIPMHASHTATYNHAIAGLMLGEVFGHVNGERSRRVKKALQKALQYTLDLQVRPKAYPNDHGGWRYLRIQGAPHDADSDISVTGWQLMFLRSARNAEFKVPEQAIQQALDYVHRCWDDGAGMFRYEISAGQSHTHGRGLMGSAILTLSLGGRHESPEAIAAGNWLLAHPFTQLSERGGNSDRFFYSTYYCSQAAAQLGGRYWTGIFAPIAHILIRAQHVDGSFPLETAPDQIFGPVYSSSLAVLSLTPAYQILPVYQR
jgi:hypothetical protein